MYYIGLDIGSISVNAVLMTAACDILRESYARTQGQPLDTAVTVLEKLLHTVAERDISGIAVTGSGSHLLAETLNCFFVNEIIAQSTATARLYPQVRTVIEIGGEDAKLIHLEPDPNTGKSRIRDFAMNTVCAAGTGSFLDQQAARLGIRIEQEFGALALKSVHPPRIAGRCSVFAKSDMIHLQQTATATHDILMGLCMAMARNFKSNAAKGIKLEKPVAFQGGVAANPGMVRAFETVLDMTPGELVIPKHFFSMGAVGAVLSMLAKDRVSPFAGITLLKNRPRAGARDHKSLPPLPNRDYRIRVSALPLKGTVPVDAWLGVDVGSISTNLVVIDRNKRVIARRYLMTAGKPIEAVRTGLVEIGKELARNVRINGATTTGSGRYLIADVIGADFAKNEITAHARGAAVVDPQVDTIFEIGGQDSKYIRLENGIVTDFTMNKVCAAGTGSFLEEQAEKLGVNIKDEFGRLALLSKAPTSLGERCTVFMESSLNHQQQHGAEKKDLVAGLCYSIVQNYLNRVVEDRPIGRRILFQGGTAYNRGVKAAFEKVCGKKIRVPEHHDVLGALGAALIALENLPRGPSRFRGFDLGNRRYRVSTFECTDCPNHCEIRKVSIEGARPFHYGSRCGKYDEEKRRSPGKKLPRLFAEREKLLLNSYVPSPSLSPDAPTVGIPRATLFFEMFPFWNAFFSELGFRVVTSTPTCRETVTRGCETVVEEICFPIKVAHGHVRELLDRKTDYLFLPCIINMEQLSRDAQVSYNCPFVQSFPYLAAAALDCESSPVRILTPVFHFEDGKKKIVPRLKKLARDMGRSGKSVGRAIRAAYRALDCFRENLQQRGREILRQLPRDVPCLVIVSRPYNGCDTGLNFKIPEKLRDLGALAIPLDFLPPGENGGPDMKTMYWRYGQQILGAAETIRSHPQLNAVYITNFSCGPDSFITKYFKRGMQNKPFLTLELDEHSADAGIITRLEAYLESLTAAPGKALSAVAAGKQSLPKKDGRIKIYIPHMDDHGTALAAAMRYNGIEAEALPMANEKTIEIGRRYTTGKECFPCILTTGDIVKKTMAHDFDPDHAGFFMPSAMGPCRFGQYSRFHRLVLDGLGLKSVPMIILDQTRNYDRDLSRLGNRFRLMGWQSVIMIDYLKKLLLQTRPYEKTPGATDIVYQACLAKIVRDIDRYGKLNGCTDFIAESFAAIPVTDPGSKPLIGIVGEIFVRSNQFSNDFFIRKIEKLGGEAVMPAVQEWVSYTDWMRLRDFRRAGNFRACVAEIFKNIVQNRCVGQIGKPLKKQVAHFHRESPTPHIMDLCARYCARDLRGEATLSMGRAVEYAAHGCHGIANLIPFNCMPGTIVNTLMTRFSKDYPNLPILKMVYDGSRQSGDWIRIEAFMHQAAQIRDFAENN